MRLRLTLLLLLVLSAYSSAQDWPMFQHDVAHTGSQDAVSNLNLSDMGVIWEYRTGDRMYYSPVAADLDGDGMLEVVFTTLEGMVYALKACGSLLWTYDAGAPLTSPPAVGEGETGMFIVFVTSDGGLLFLNSTGSLLREYNMGVEVYSTSVGVGDVDEDGSMDVVFNSIAVDEDGTPLDYDITTLAQEGYAGDYTLVLDADGDGAYEMYWGHQPKMPAAADVNGDGEVEIIKVVEDISDKRSEIQVFDASLRLLVSMDAEGINSPVVTGDLDGDGWGEILFCDDIGVLHVVDSRDWSEGTRGVTYSKCTHTIIADLNSDASLEVIMASEDGGIYTLGSLKDSDGDGLSDYTEDFSGLDKFSQDTDGDGLDDMRDEEPTEARVVEVVQYETDEWGVISEDIGFLLALVLIGVLGVVLGRKFGFLPSKLKIGFLAGSGGSSYSLRRRKVDVAREWEDALSSRGGVDENLAVKLASLVSEGPISSNDAVMELGVSKIKLAKYAMLLKDKGFIEIDSKSSVDNPILKPTKKLVKSRR